MKEESNQQLNLSFCNSNTISLDLPGNLCSYENIKMNPPYGLSQFQNEEDEDKAYKEFFGFSSNKSTLTIDINDYDLYFQKTRENTQIKANKEKKNIFIAKKVPKVFMIKKIDKHQRKKGRRSSKDRSSCKPIHDKNSIDNISIKIKRHFVEGTRNYINEKYKEYLSNKEIKKKDKFLLRINPNCYRYNKYSIQTNKEFLEWPLYQLFSSSISRKYKNCSEDYNRKQIKKLFDENEAKEVIEIMRMTMKEIYIKYINNEITDFNLEKDLIVFDKKYGEDYKNRFRQKAKNLVYNFSRKRFKNNNCFRNKKFKPKKGL